VVDCRDARLLLFFGVDSVAAAFSLESVVVSDFCRAAAFSDDGADLDSMTTPI
jgi:hypothetical protein